MTSHLASVPSSIVGLRAGIFNSIPYYGPLIVSGGLAMVAFLQFGTLYMMLAMVGYAVTSTLLTFAWLEERAA